MTLIRVSMSDSPSVSSTRCWKALAALAILLAIARVTASYRHTSEAFDEPCHVSAGLELLDHHTYTLDPVHPPLSRLAIGLPLYLAGERYPRLTTEESAQPNYNVVGNHILYDDGHYLRNLILARVALLPFLLIASVLVFAWARREFGDVAAFISVLIFTTTPIVLALSSIAYSDLVTATTQCAALFAFTIWLDNRSWRSTLLLGGAIGLALMSKLTSFMFLPAAAAAIVACRGMMTREPIAKTIACGWKQLSAAAVIAIIALWSGYGFSVGRVQDGMGISPQQMPSFQHFPAPVAKAARAMVLNDWFIPAPAFLRGVANAWVLNKTSPSAYLMGQSKPGGWWYFFLAGLIFKSPLPLLLLGAAGLYSVAILGRAQKWSALAPAVCTLAILIITMPVKYNAGLRHVLVVFPLIAIGAGCGGAFLWRMEGNQRKWARSALVILLLWQGFETIRAQSDFISYFNELAGRDPSQVLVAGCDLDCGQDLFRLSDELRSRQISQFNLAVWSSADVNRMGLPEFQIPQPYQPVTGWLAISARAQRLGEVLHERYPPNSFAWLQSYHPVAKVGHTIRLYYIPAKTASRQP